MFILEQEPPTLETIAEIKEQDFSGYSSDFTDVGCNFFLYSYSYSYSHLISFSFSLFLFLFEKIRSVFSLPTRMRTLHQTVCEPLLDKRSR